ncbi:hypothetical protein BCR36DRAFT_374114 [Piromyces finnis]|uniref:Uncharacterized protein n=1 Tax=Piromyces finnis TaxID=1754191 RepID=A0A1Y1UXW1_9FUNG|nr:hypothetical protein BCR36DRAFT_374114 [Piromyces finnis]|eukprot:ORX43043.1 hypothetical protein BCR36DRAFT_374114 [Piromyces finnis]
MYSSDLNNIIFISMVEFNNKLDNRVRYVANINFNNTMSKIEKSNQDKYDINAKFPKEGSIKLNSNSSSEKSLINMHIDKSNINSKADEDSNLIQNSGISIINCNNLTKDQYIINYSNNNINDNLNNFLLINTLEKICNEKIFKYNFDLKDTTKTNYYISKNIPSYTLKDIYNKIIKLELPNTCQYVTAFIKRINYYHYFNKRYTETYHYNQVLIAKDKNKDVKDSDNFIIIKCCHDSIRITRNKITFYERDTYDNIICKLLPCLNYSSDQILIRFKPSIVSFTYPININFQLFDLMLYENALYPYIYTNENEDIIKNKEKLVYTMNIFNQSLNMKLYNKYKQFTEIIQFQELEWYIYFNNKDKILPVIADKEKCINNNIPYVQWNNNYYRSPENSGYKIALSTNKNSIDNNFVFHDKKILFDSVSELNVVPKCVKVIRKYKEKEKSV